MFNDRRGCINGGTRRNESQRSFRPRRLLNFMTWRWTFTLSDWKFRYEHSRFCGFHVNNPRRVCFRSVLNLLLYINRATSLSSKNTRSFECYAEFRQIHPPVNTRFMLPNSRKLMLIVFGFIYAHLLGFMSRAVPKNAPDKFCSCCKFSKDLYEK